LVFIAIQLSAFCGEVPDNMQLFLLIGQSNMAGRGKVEACDQEVNPRIFMLDKDMKWVPAKDPVHFDKASAGVGLCSQFARDILKNNPNITIGLIPCAFGGTRIDEWKPGAKLYDNAVARTKEAMKKGVLKGILWHQGESDSGRPDIVKAYPDKFIAMIAKLRKDLAAEKVPLLVGELSRQTDKYADFNANLPGIVEKVQPCVLVKSDDLKLGKDNLHFDSQALRSFGSRYAEAYMKASLRN
jgi:hypothetical protein